jgi:hypothetical protein
MHPAGPFKLFKKSEREVKGRKRMKQRAFSQQKKKKPSEES